MTMISLLMCSLLKVEEQFPEKTHNRYAEYVLEQRVGGKRPARGLSQSVSLMRSHVFLCLSTWSLTHRTHRNFLKFKRLVLLRLTHRKCHIHIHLYIYIYKYIYIYIYITYVNFTLIEQPRQRCLHKNLK
jgi:hypothetical protein